VQPAANAAPAFRRIIAIGTSNALVQLKEWKPIVKKLTVPWDQGDSDTNRLLDSENPSVGCCRSLDGPKNPLCLTCEPPSETQRVVKLTLRLSQRLAALVCNDVRQVVPVLSNKLVPFQEPLGALPWVRLAEGLEGFVRGLASRIRVLSGIIWRSGPDFVATGIVHVETFAGLCLNPLATHETLVVPELGVVHLCNGEHSDIFPSTCRVPLLLTLNGSLDAIFDVSLNCSNCDVFLLFDCRASLKDLSLQTRFEKNKIYSINTNDDKSSWNDDIVF
jgi:hypothetical protein